MKLSAPVLPRTLTPIPDAETLVRCAALSREGEGDLRGVSIEHLTLAEESLCGIVLRGACVTGCRFPACDFSGADLTDVVFTGCDLSGCDLSRTGLRRCTFTDCKFVGAQFADCAVLEVSFADCKLDDSNLVSAALRKSMLTRCRMRNARFAECTLSMLNLEAVDLTRGTVFHTPLNGLDLTQTILDGLIADPESLYGALVSRDQAADLAPLFGLRISP